MNCNHDCEKMKKINKFIREFRLNLNQRFDLNKYTGAVNLNLGCGNRPLRGFVNVDKYNRKYADEIYDLNKEIPVKSDSVDLVYSDNVFEHISNILDLMKECQRILKPGGHLVTRVPYFKSKSAFVDPTHVNYFTVRSMDYFVKGTYFYDQYRFFDNSFRQKKILLDPDRSSIIGRLPKALFLTASDYLEDSLWSSLIIYENIVYILKK